MAQKEIYSFTTEINESKEVSEVKKEKNKDTGKLEEVTISKKKNVPVRYRVIIKQPNRRQMEEADMEYSIEMSKCIKKGILTKAMLAKKYSDLGGMMTEDDALQLNKNYAKIGELQTEYQRLVAKSKKSEKDLSTIKSLLLELTEVRSTIVNLETAYSTLFNHTADTKAQNRAIMWYIVNLSYFQEEDAEGDPANLFEGVSSDEKLEQYYVFDEEGKSEIFNSIKNKLTTFVSYWFFSNQASTEDFDSLNDEIEGEDNSSEPDEEEKEEAPLVEPVKEAPPEEKEASAKPARQNKNTRRKPAKA
jgi:hypothetical protein